MCEGRFGVLQQAGEPSFEHCPYCGLDVQRVISAAAFKLSKGDFGDAAKRGFTTFRKSEEGVWERVAGEGVDAIVSPDKAAELADEP